jgi:hypothetical protein
MSLRATEHIFNGATTPITNYDSSKTNLGSLMIQKSGRNPEDNFVGPVPVVVARPMEESMAIPGMFPHVISYSPEVDWVFLIENTIAAAKRITLYEYNKITATYNRNGYITATTQVANSTVRGFRALRYLHSTGTVSVDAPVAVYTGAFNVSMAVGGVVTGVGTTFLIGHVGMMIGFGSQDPTLINCWYPIISFTSALIITVSGASNVIAASTNWVIASCVVTGTGGFVSELIAAGANTTGVAGGLGPRIGFGSTNPLEITQWFQIGRITDDTHINLVTSPGVIPAGTNYVIEELRFVIVTTNALAATSGGVFLVKGVGILDFQTNTIGALVLPAVATAVPNQRGVYWLCDNGAGTVRNQSACGCAIDGEISKTEHWAYIIDGLGDVAKIYKYNLRANNTVATGKMQLAGANIIVTGNQTLSGFISHSNNGRVGTLNHGPASGVKSLYFVTSTRLYRAILGNIIDSSTNFVDPAESRLEVPPGGITSFPFTYDLACVEIIDSIDRLIVLTSGINANRNYITAYPTNDGDEFTHIWGLDDKQQDTSLVPPMTAPPHFNSKSQPLSVWSENGISHVVAGGNTLQLNQMYALPFGVHATYASSTNQVIITPSISTPNCVKFSELLINFDRALGEGEMLLPSETFKVYYRIANITTDTTSSWNLIGVDRDLSIVAPASAIQFKFEFFIIGLICLPARIFNIAVTYEDEKTDSHYQLSATLSDINTKTFSWRFSQSFGGTVPTLELLLFNAETGASLPSDTTLTTTNGTWSKSINGGSNWIDYDTNDKTNDNTYIRYTSTSGSTDDVRVRAVLNQY